MTVSPTFAQTATTSHPLTLPRFESSQVDGFFHIDLTTGEAYLSDRLSNPPPRTRALGQNVSKEIGLAAGLSIGDLLLGPIRNGDGSLKAAVLVEAATGYVAYFDDLGRDSKLGRISVAIGRPFEPIATDDRAFTLLMRRDNAGRTEGAYVYHATTGKTLYLDGMRKLDPAGQVTPTSPWPILSRRAVSVSIQSAREETVGYWISDPATGECYRVDLSRNSKARLTANKLPVNLADAVSLQGPHPTYEPLVVVGIEDRSDQTRHLFLLAASSGEMAVWLDFAGGGGTSRLVKIQRNLYDVLGADVATSPRTFAAVPRLGSNGVEGVFLIDSLTRSILLAANLTDPGAFTLSSYGKIDG